MPYLKGKCVIYLYFVRIARIGSRKEGQKDNDPNDLRLVFEIEFIGQMFNAYQMIELPIWHTFNDGKLGEIVRLCKEKVPQSIT